MKYPSRQDPSNIWTSDELDLAQHEGFTFVPEQFSILDSSKNLPSRHYLYTHLGYGIELRYSQAREEWAAFCPHFGLGPGVAVQAILCGIEIQFPHGKPNVIRTRLNTWLLDYIKDVVRPLPAVLELAQQRDCTLDEAQAIFDERASL